MKNILNKIGLKNSRVSAQVIDGHLVVSLPHAQPPVIWRMALDTIGTAAFGVIESKKDNQSDLVLKPKKGAGEIIASFETKEQAVEALVAASNALQNQSASKSGVPSNSTSPKTEKQKWVLALLGAFIVIGLYYYLMTLIPENAVDIAAINQTSTIGAPASSDTGVPVSADDYFNELQ